MFFVIDFFTVFKVFTIFTVFNIFKSSSIPSFLLFLLYFFLILFFPFSHTLLPVFFLFLPLSPLTPYSLYIHSHLSPSIFHPSPLLLLLLPLSSLTAGAAPAVNLLTPWLWPDRRKTPKIPIWPSDIREFISESSTKNEENSTKKDKSEGSKYGEFPQYVPSVDEMIDLSGSR